MKAEITVKSIPTYTPRDKPYEIVDTKVSGLILRIQPTGTATFYYCYKAEGRNRRFKIGPGGKFITSGGGKTIFETGIHPDVARNTAKKKAGEVASGIDPQEERQQRRKEQVAAKAKSLAGFLDIHYASFLATERRSGSKTEKRIRSLFSWLLDTPMDTITPLQIQSWRKKQLEGGKSPVTVNRDLADLKSMLSKAVELGVITEHPLAKLKPVKTDDNSRVRYLSPDEERRLFEALDKRESEAREARRRFNEWRRQRRLDPLPEITEQEFSDHLKPLIILALNVGLRRGELFKLEWQDIDFAHNILTVRAAAAKGGKPRHIPLNPIALQTLKQWKKQGSGSSLVFPGKNGERLDNIASSWRSVITESKIKDFHFHDCRHDFATKILRSGTDIVVLSKLMGHATLKMTLRYAHVSDTSLVTAVDRLANSDR